MERKSILTKPILCKIMSCIHKRWISFFMSISCIGGINIPFAISVSDYPYHLFHNIRIIYYHFLRLRQLISVFLTFSCGCIHVCVCVFMYVCTIMVRIQGNQHDMGSSNCYEHDHIISRDEILP